MERNLWKHVQAAKNSCWKGDDETSHCGSVGRPVSGASGDHLPVELHRYRTSAHQGRPTRALPARRRRGLARTPVRWNLPVDELWVGRGENSAGVPVNPVDAMLDPLERAGDDPKQSGASWSARCPSHDDQNVSLSVSEARDGRVLVKCPARCTTVLPSRRRLLRVEDLYAFVASLLEVCG